MKIASPLERLGLQTVVAIFGLIPVCAGISGMIRGTRMIDPAATSLSLDSHYRYLSGVLLAIGCAYWSMIPSISKHRARFQLLTLLVFVGGIGRLIGVLVQGLPSLQMLGGLTMELVVTPLLCLWQARLDRSQGHRFAGLLSP